MSEPFPHDPDRTAVHGPESTGSAVSRATNTLATEVGTPNT
jgi:hypothetical protein